VREDEKGEGGVLAESAAGKEDGGEVSRATTARREGDRLLLVGSYVALKQQH